MDVNLDPGDRKDLDDLARLEGRDPGELLRELVHEAIADRKRSGASSEETELRAQEKAWDDLLQELDALPEVKPKDVLCPSMDHDQVLYGGPAPGQKGGFPERRS